MKICPRFPEIYFLIFSAIAFVFSPKTAEAQSRWSNSPQQNNEIVALSNDQFSPAIARDGRDGAIIVWVDNRSGNFDLFGQRIDVAGDLKWNDGGNSIAEALNAQESPAMVEAGSGGVFIAWQDNRLLLVQREIAVQRFDGDGAPVWPQAARAHLGNNGLPRILLDNSGTIFTAAYTTIFINQAISAQIIDAANGSVQFTQQRFFDQNADALETDQVPSVTTGLSGGLIAAWADARNDTTLLAMGLLNDGNPWTPGLITLSQTALGTAPAAISDGSEGAIIVWIEPIAGSENHLIKATRLNASGGMVWTPGIQEINTTDGPKRRLKIADDGANGAFIIWENRIDSNWQIFVQRISNDGLTWNNDTAAAIVSSNQTNAQVINNRKGDALVVWEDDRDLSSGIDLYIQRISDAGVRAWEQEIAVTNAVSAQQKPVLTDDGFGGAIVAWEDLRNGNADIFAQRVSPTGVLGEFRTISITAPAPGENWEIGSQRVIRWSASPEIDSVKIELSRNGGQSFETLIEKIANANPEGNSYAVTVDGDPASNSVVRITAVQADFIFDESDPFIISAPQGPTLNPLQIQDANAGENLTVATDVSDISGVQNVQLQYKMGGERAFTPVNMERVGQNQFRGDIPGEAVTNRGLEYFVFAADSIGTPSRSDTFVVRVNFEAGAQVARVNRGSSQNAYRMFSSPNLLDQPAAEEIFLNSNFGAYDTTSWRLFQFRNNTYVEFDTATNANTFLFSPGQAYWVISGRDRNLDFGAGQSQRSDRNAAVTIPRGWSQIGNPFVFTVEWDTVLTASGVTGADIDGPFLYEGAYGPPVTLIEPYKGYFVLNKTAGPVTLQFPPFEAAAAAVLAKESLVPGTLWELQIQADCREARDHFNVLGIHPQSSQQWDRFDYAEPPPIGDFISVYFPRSEWGVYPEHYTSDFRHEIGAGQTWSFSVRSNIPGAEARLQIAGVETLPEQLEIWLVDERLNIKQDVRREQQFVFSTGERGTKKSLKLVIGTSDYLANELAGESFIPKDFELSQNFPNPFNPVTTIRYGLPKAAKVSLTIYDLLGREVVTLIDNENKPPGFHVVTWNGKDKQGNGVASGLYIYRIAADKFVQSRKMLIVK